MTTPFITPEDESMVLSQRPEDIGQAKLRHLRFDMSMTDEEIDAIAEQAKKIRDDYYAWQEFYEDLELRKKRYMGFQAVVHALDLNVAAAMMKTTPELVAAVMSASAQQEAARLAELQALWDSGQLPDRPVLTDPSKEVLNS